MNVLGIPLRIPGYRRPANLHSGYSPAFPLQRPTYAEVQEALVEAVQAIELNARHAFYGLGMSQIAFEATWKCDDKDGFEQWSRLIEVADEARPGAANDAKKPVSADAVRLGKDFDVDSLEHGDTP